MLGVVIVGWGELRVSMLDEVADLGYFVVTLALAVRFYFLAMSRAREAKAPDC